jgi:hypothetical protein
MCVCGGLTRTLHLYMSSTNTKDVKRKFIAAQYPEYMDYKWDIAGFIFTKPYSLEPLDSSCPITPNRRHNTVNNNNNNNNNGILLTTKTTTARREAPPPPQQQPTMMDNNNNNNNDIVGNGNDDDDDDIGEVDDVKVVDEVDGEFETKSGRFQAMLTSKRHSGTGNTSQQQQRHSASAATMADINSIILQQQQQLLSEIDLLTLPLLMVRSCEPPLTRERVGGGFVIKTADPVSGMMLELTRFRNRYPMKSKFIEFKVDLPRSSLSLFATPTPPPPPPALLFSFSFFFFIAIHFSAV